MTEKENLENVLKSLGWSKKKLAREVYVELNEIDNEKEISNFEDKVKKQFQRSSTKDEIFGGYMKNISNHRDFQQLDLIMPNFKSTSILSEQLANGISLISKELSEGLLK